MRAITSTPPRIQPIVPVLRPAPFNDADWLFEPKYDGFLEGIVAKRKADSYQLKTAWYKIKNPAYTQAEGRRELFERR